MSDRKYPDIEFVETDTETIESNLIALYESLVQQVPGRERYKVYPASPERLFISWIASIIVQQRVLINDDETAAMEKLFFNTNTTTAIDVAQARGVLLLALTKKRIHCSEFTPLQVKQAVTGYGRADKQQVEAMVKMLLKLEKIPRPDDAADALAMAICCAHCLRF